MPCWRLADVVLVPGGKNWKLIWCCCLVVETGNWCWFGVAAWWWKLEADADFGAGAWWWKLEANVVLLPGGGNWKLMLVWCCYLVVESGSWCWFGAASWWWKLKADADLVLLIVAWISGLAVGHWKQVPGSLGGCPEATGVCAVLAVCWFCWFAGLSLPWVKPLDTGWIRLMAKVNLVAVQTLNGPPGVFLALFDPFSSQ